MAGAVVGIYQHCGEQHLQRYLDEFTFRWNNRSKLGIEDEERARVAAYGMNDKRLTYQWTEASGRITSRFISPGNPGVQIPLIPSNRR
jgi:hypothetical protein